MKEMNELLRFCANEYERIECVSCSYLIIHKVVDMNVTIVCLKFIG